MNSKDEMKIFRMETGMFQYFLLFHPPRKIDIHTPSIALKLRIHKNPKNIDKFQKTLSPIAEKFNSNSQKQVKFADKPDIRPMRVWQFAHRQARMDVWQQAGRDRIRFEKRINELGEIISPNLIEKIEKFTKNSRERK